MISVTITDCRQNDVMVHQLIYVKHYSSILTSYLKCKWNIADKNTCSLSQVESLAPGKLSSVFLIEIPHER